MQNTWHFCSCVFWLIVSVEGQVLQKYCNPKYTPCLFDFLQMGSERVELLSHCNQPVLEWNQTETPSLWRSQLFQFTPKWFAAVSPAQINSLKDENTPGYDSNGLNSAYVKSPLSSLEKRYGGWRGSARCVWAREMSGFVLVYGCVLLGILSSLARGPQPCRINRSHMAWRYAWNVDQEHLWAS